MLTGRARADLLASYDAERRPHARAMVKKAVRVGWAMTGGQDRAAAICRIALAAAVRSERVCQAMGSTATPQLKAGALQHAPRRLLPSRIPAALRIGGLIPNPLVSTGDGTPVRLDAILAGRTAVLTARQPEPPGNYGPVPVIIRAELTIAHNGSLDGYFQGSQQQMNTNTYQATMFFSDGTLWANIVTAQGIADSQWGVMNELWNFPGQVWLWLYAGMYQIPALNPSTNANLDLDVGLLMIVFGFLLPMFAPWIPGINRIPRWIPLYKIIYRKYYHSTGGGQPPLTTPGEPASPPSPQ